MSGYYVGYFVGSRTTPNFVSKVGHIRVFAAYRIPMTAMPELVAGFHSLVGLAAVFVAISAFINPAAFNLGVPGDIKLASLIEMAIGAAVGAITFSGSVIAFLKLQGIISGALSCDLKICSIINAIKNPITNG